MVTKQRNNLFLGVLLAGVAALCFALMGFFVKLVPHAIPSVEIIFFRFIIGLILLIPFVLTRRDFSFKMHRPALYLLRISLALISLSCMFYSLRHVALVNVILLFNTSPLFMPILVFVFMGIKTHRTILISILIGFVGIIFVLHPTAGLFNPVALFAVAGGFTAACAYLTVRKLTLEHSTLQLVFYLFLFCTFISGLAMLPYWVTPDKHSLFLLLMVGIVGVLFQLLITMALKIAKARLVTPIIYLAVIFGGVLQWIAFGQVPHVNVIIGSCLVIIGAIATVYFGGKLEPPQLKEKTDANI